MWPSQQPKVNKKTLQTTNHNKQPKYKYKHKNNKMLYILLGNYFDHILITVWVHFEWYFGVFMSSALSAFCPCLIISWLKLEDILIMFETNLSNVLKIFWSNFEYILSDILVFACQVHFRLLADIWLFFYHPLFWV